MNMRFRHLGLAWVWQLALLSVLAGSVGAAEPPAGFVGKNEWLFYRYEFAEPEHATEIKKSVQLIRDFSKVLGEHGTQLVVAMVPLKIRVYAEHLPDDVKLNDTTLNQYANTLDLFRSNGVFTVDLNTAFLNSPKRNSDTPLFFRLDTHWTPSGAMVAAETIKAGLYANPATKAAAEAMPEVAYNIKVAPRKRASRGRDLITVLPPNSPVFAPEMVAQVNVIPVQAGTTPLVGDVPIPEFAVVGSSYSRDWTGFVDAMRYVFQRDMVSFAVGADQGSWVGMETYLREDTYKQKHPKILIWEMPERDMRAPPDYKFRESRYISSNAAWLTRVSGLVKAETGH
ncbi:hypothetical protein [Rhodoferax sp.]|uniref:alginate O-acetyltransferase AlgX-related protein n=1 Tax=Rhodoferax sp. TaxID=50421 RepID=UPI00261667B6|nr:hypothetical protein [Rhodoferax sp.]MDD2925366.1 hypothetical protein [Rhodoferax sp.]